MANKNRFVAFRSEAYFVAQSHRKYGSVILVSCTRNNGTGNFNLHHRLPSRPSYWFCLQGLDCGDVYLPLSDGSQCGLRGFLVKAVIVLIDASGYRYGMIWYVLSER